MGFVIAMKNNILMNKERHLRNIWWVVIFFLVLLAVLFPSILLSQKFSIELSVTHQAIIILMVSIVCQLLRRKSINELIGKINWNWIKELGIGLIVGSALMLLPAMVLTALGFITWQHNEFYISTLASGLSLFLAVALAEELLFRGFIFQRLIDAFGQWPAQILIAGLFLLTHLNNMGMTGNIKLLAGVNIFLASILFGQAYIRTKSLALPIGVHFMANFMQGTILGFGVSGTKENSLLKPVFGDSPIWLTGGDFGIEASAVGLLFVILFTFLLWRNTFKREMK